MTLIIIKIVILKTEELLTLLELGLLITIIFIAAEIIIEILK